MTEPELNGKELAREYPLTVLKDIPIGQPYIEAMTRILTEHGATLTETHNSPDPEQPYKVYTITFPQGTVRSFGIQMMRSRYFLILFPDGFQLRGGELWPLYRREGDQATTVLHLPESALK